MSGWSDIQDRSSGEQVRKEDIPPIEVDAYFEVESRLWSVSFLCDDESYMDDKGAFFLINWYSEKDFDEIEDEVMGFISEVKKDMTIKSKKDIDTLMREVKIRSDERTFQIRLFGSYKLFKVDEHYSFPCIKMFEAERVSSYDGHELTETQNNQLRWHSFELCLKDARFKDCVTLSNGLITRLGDTGEKVVKGFFLDVIKKYGQFDGYVEDKFDDIDFSKNLTEKNKMMINETSDRIHKHNLELLGIDN